MSQNSNTLWAKDCAEKIAGAMMPEEINAIIETKMVFTIFKRYRQNCKSDETRRRMIDAENKAVDVLNFYYSSLIRDQLNILITKTKSNEPDSN